MIFSVDLDIKFLMKKIRPSVRDGSSPDGGAKSLIEVSPLLTQREELKFHRVIKTNSQVMDTLHCQSRTKVKVVKWC